MASESIVRGLAGILPHKILRNRWFLGSIVVVFIALWIRFFPPGVYVRDSFGSIHKDLRSSLPAEAYIQEGTLHLPIPPGTAYRFLYKKTASERATIEATTIWKEGDDQSLFGIVCCAVDEENFLLFAIRGNGDYSLLSRVDGKWSPLTQYLQLPEENQIQKNRPYKLKLVTEGHYISLFMNETLLLKMIDAVHHAGRAGIFAQSGQQKAIVAFDFFKAKKNSLFQNDP